ncbi:hypothetical protein RFI_19378 [Reticulomyxa filosa]|uniref:Uncharacterized protein n=1 Tax=Reticulomyxa filosa TaxID=46433 RepID=X6MXY4_RETFI|nr:hypothetical protein RFI_19378 [Reticulomyxa filosa]|eukprot:ETO17930.1 hypothetical protein RFI_19378 [Reticulomyxa filosa]
MTPEFREQVFNLTLRDVTKNNKNEKDKPFQEGDENQKCPDKKLYEKKQTKRRRVKVLTELQKLFGLLQNKTTTTVSTKGLTNAFGWNSDEVILKKKTKKKLYMKIHV